MLIIVESESPLLAMRFMYQTSVQTRIPSYIDFARHAYFDKNEERLARIGYLEAAIKLLPVFQNHDVILSGFHLTEICYGIHVRFYNVDHVWEYDRVLAASPNVRLVYIPSTMSFESPIEDDIEVPPEAMEYAYNKSMMKKTRVDLSKDNVEAVIKWVYA